jgi:short subunit dehydrogenase-like uncharacterized protein
MRVDGEDTGRLESEVWILGGTGRSGRAIAAELLSRGVTPVLVGRDRRPAMKCLYLALMSLARASHAALEQTRTSAGSTIGISAGQAT